MTLMSNLFFKATTLSPSQLKLLFLLLVSAFLLGFGLVLFDVGTTLLFLKDNGLFRLNFLFFLIPLIVLTGGIYRHVLFQRRGKSGVFYAFFLLGCLGGVFAAFHFYKPQWLTDILFLGKYALWITLSVSFWSVAIRFVPKRPDSLKFVVVSCFEFLGMMLAGWVVVAFHLNSSVLCFVSLGIILIGLIFLMIFAGLKRSPAMTFFYRQAGSSDVAEKPLIYTALGFSFFYFSSKAVAEFSFLNFLWNRETFLQVEHALAIFWALFGMAGFLLLFFLHRTRSSYTTLSGMLVFFCSFLLLGGGLITESFVAVLCGFLLFHLSCCFYANNYISLLPLILTSGRAKPFEKTRDLIIEPLGFLTGAIVLFFVPLSFLQGVAFIFCGLILSGCFLLSYHFYARLLSRIFKNRLWRAGPFLILYPSLLRYIHARLSVGPSQEVIYFLRILEAANHSSFQKCLLKSLKSSSQTVRLFVLERLERLFFEHNFYKTVERVFERDPSLVVRQKALSLLIRFAPTNKLPSEAYAAYLDDPKLRVGAVIGFLKSGGDRALLAAEVLQRLALSSRKQDHLAVLEIMRQAPSPGLVRFLQPFLKTVKTTFMPQALLAAGAIGHPQFLPDIFNALEEAPYQDYALQALKLYGKKAFPPIEKLLQNKKVSLIKKRKLILFLGALKSGEGKQILIRNLNSDDLFLRKNIMETLFLNRVVWMHKDKQKILMCSLLKDVEHVSWIKKFEGIILSDSSYEGNAAWAHLKQVFKAESDQIRSLILYQLALLVPERFMYKAVHSLLSARTELYPAALSILQDLVRADLFEKIYPVLMEEVAEEKNSPRIFSSCDAATYLGDVFLKPPFSFDAWTRAVILNTLQKLRKAEGLPAVEGGLGDSSSYVVEAAVQALFSLEKNEQRRHDLLLKVPTRFLVCQPLEALT